MCDKSILVLISSSPRSVRALRAEEVCASADPRIWARTFSASCSSSELEWVFFSVTPTSGSASRMALLLTSSSLARSLIRTLLIRPFFSPRALGLHRSLTESICGTRIPSKMSARAMIIQLFREQNLFPAHALDFRPRESRLRPRPREQLLPLRRMLPPLLRQRLREQPLPRQPRPQRRP